VAMLACHRSQVFEWLPYLDGIGDRVPRGQSERIAWLRTWYTNCLRPRTERFRQALVAAYGPARGNEVRACEVFEISQYAAPANPQALRRLFPGMGAGG
jgi:N-acetylglucosamine malate deacetylase 1